MPNNIPDKSHEDYHNESAARPIAILVHEISHALTMADVHALTDAIAEIRRRHQSGLWEARHFDGKHEDGSQHNVASTVQVAEENP